MLALVVVAVLVGIFYFYFWFYLKRTTWCRSQTCLVGKTAIITGANSGIGYQTALVFSKRGARVILACRDKEKAENAQKSIVNLTGNQNVVVKIFNLASLASVRSFAENINQTEENIDILVNNAGAGGIGNKNSEDGLSLYMQVNYFGSFLLTNLLLGLLKKSGNARIINVSSVAAKYSLLDIDDLNKFPGYYYTYANSKLCNILFTMELAEKLKNTKVLTFSVHPGAVQTDIFRRFQGWQKVVLNFFKSNFFRTSEEGAQTSIYVALTEGLEDFSGQHFYDCQRVEPYETAMVPGLPQQLWEKTEKLVKLKAEERQY